MESIGRITALVDATGTYLTQLKMTSINDLPCTPRGGVGFGVRLLARWVLALVDGTST